MIYNETMDLDENFRQNFEEKKDAGAQTYFRPNIIIIITTTKIHTYNENIVKWSLR